MNRLITLFGLLAFTLQAWGAAQWQNIHYSTNPVTYAVITNVMGFTGSTTTYLRSDGTQATPAGTGAYAVTNYFITPSTGITVATNVTGTNVTWTLSSTATGGGNMTNAGPAPAVVGMVPVATDTTGTQWTPTNSISLEDVIAGTLSLSNMLANVVPVFDANTNMVPSSMTTNVLDLLYSQSGNITNWGKLTTNEFLPLAGGTVTGPVLSTSPTTNGPTTLELATAGWVRSLLANGSLLYNSTNLVGTAFDASTYLYVGSEPTNGSRSYTPSAGDYIGTVMTTNRYEEVVGPIHITTFFTSSGGAASAQYTLHPEIYYTYDTNSATLLGDYASAPQAITHGAITNQYDFVVSFPPIINTNGAGNGFYIVRRFKIDTKTGTDTLKLSLGTNGVNNTSSHIAFSTPAIAGANWVAVGTTNASLAGDARPYSITIGGTNIIGELASKGTASGMVGTVSNAVVSAGLLAVDSTKTNGIAATKAHITNAWGIFDGNTSKYVDGSGALSTPTGAAGQPANAGLTNLSSASPFWGAPAVSDGTNAIYLPMNSGFVLFDDFLSFLYGSDVGGSMNWIPDVNASGTVTSASGTATNPGQVAFNLATASGSRASMGSGGQGQDSILFGGGLWYEEIAVKVSALSDGTDSYQIRMGFSDTRIDADPTDGVYFRYTDSVNSGLWEGVCSANGSRTAVNIGLAPSASVFQRLGILVAADASSVVFYTNGVAAVTNTLNIPSGAGRGTGPCNVGLTRTAGNSNTRSLWLDFVYLYHKLTTPR